MRDIHLIGQDIRSVKERYRTHKLSFVIDQSEMLRDISCCYMDLTDHKIYERERWLDAYNEFKGSHAAKERFADTQVPEYDKIKDLLTACKVLKESIVSTLSANKNG
jgi:hypothetical protein